MRTGSALDTKTQALTVAFLVYAKDSILTPQTVSASVTLGIRGKLECLQRLAVRTTFRLRAQSATDAGWSLHPSCSQHSRCVGCGRMDIETGTADMSSDRKHVFGRCWYPSKC
jgi:hypothetical protein